jgi:hypothetical protein
MKHFLLFVSMALCADSSLHAQPVAKADMEAIAMALPDLPLTLEHCAQLTRPNTASGYQKPLHLLEQYQTEANNIQRDFYLKNPTGMAPQAITPANPVSSKNQAAMDAATASLAHKLLNDKAFAAKFAQMSEAEKQAYITNALAENGIKPAVGAPDASRAAVPGTDVDWLGLCQQSMSPNTGMARWEKQTRLQQEYQDRHAAIDAVAETAIQRLPMIEMGEYGRDHDPQRVKAIQEEARQKHKALATQMLVEMAPMLESFRRDTRERLHPLNTALQSVKYGKSYLFGAAYTTVLQTQTAHMGEWYALIQNEISLLETVVFWDQ